MSIFGTYPFGLLPLYAVKQPKLPVPPWLAWLFPHVDATIGAVTSSLIMRAGSARKRENDGQQAWEKTLEGRLAAQAACAPVCLADWIDTAGVRLCI